MQSNASSPAVRVVGLQKTYAATKKSAAKEALKGIDLEIPRGSFFGLLGPNGAGKSTLINTMAGLVNKTGGTVEICGYDIDSQTRQARRSIGVVPQELVLDVFFTVRDALELQAGYYGVPKAKRRTSEIIEAMGLADKADVPPRRLSGGMRRRLLIAKALVHAPDVLVLDEPTAGVDVELRTQLWDYVRELNKQGTTILLTTHYLEEAEELCDQLAIINHGSVIAHDSKRALMKRFDRKEAVFRTKDAFLTVPSVLKELDAHINAEGALVISYQPSLMNVLQLLDQVREAGIVVEDLSTKEADLEDVFRSLTA